MDLSPMQPAQLWFDRLAIEATPGFTPSERADNESKVEITFSLEEGEDPGGMPVYRCRLEGRIEPSSIKALPPYQATISVGGLFVFPKGLAGELAPMRRMVAFNGSAMLYGFARDVIMHQTAFGQHGVFILPAINLTTVAENLLAGFDDTKPADRARLPAASKPTRSRRKPKTGESNVP